jgi:hypothetical protein
MKVQMKSQKSQRRLEQLAHLFKTKENSILSDEVVPKQKRDSIFPGISCWWALGGNQEKKKEKRVWEKQAIAMTKNSHR